MTLSEGLLSAITNAVEAAGGDLHDAHDLADVWDRLDADLDGRAARIRYETSHAACCCADGGEDDEDGRCSGCHGRLGDPAMMCRETG